MHRLRRLHSRSTFFMGAARFLFIFSLWGLIAMRILPAAATDTPPETEVWLTLADQSHLLSPEARLRFSAGMPPDDMHYVIRVDDSTQYQRMEGFGAAMTDSSAWLLMRLLSDRQRAEVMQNLFTREGTGIGISYVRIPIGASDFALYDYSYNDLPRGETDPQLTQFSINYDEAYIIPALQMAQRLNPQLRFMASPWSAPAWMKSGGQFHGGELLPQYYQAFADYLVRFVQAYAEHGITIDTLTPQNEPMHESPNYPTMRMSAEAQAAFIRDYLGPALQRAGLSTRLVIFDHNWDLYQYALTVLADPAAAAFVSGVGFHCYGGSVANQSIVRDAHPNVGIWFTECSGGDWSPQFAGNLSWNLHHLGIGNFRNWGNSLLLWNLALDENSGPQNGGCGDCRGVVTINQATAAVSYNVEYYVLGHFSRLIDPGAYRIASTSFIDGQPENVAFLNPDGSLVLVVHSTQDTAFAVEWRGQHFTYTLPAGAVVSFRWSGTTEDN